MIMPELLAPAGSVAALHSAVCAGADAVYLGMGAFNARRNAENFNADNIGGVCDYAHLRGVKVYVTMNTIILPGEMHEALECATTAYNAGADAFIVQDIGLVTALQRKIPGIRIHASTQMNIHNEHGVQAAAELGVKRITLARELSIGEIAHLTRVANELGVQVEAFVHGAICVCYSGQCFMSSMIGGRSANRGLCAQACRLNYDLERADGKQLDAPGDFLLSPKDLCGIDMLQELVEAGVASLKIEGRMKSPEYVSSVVSVYRDVLNRSGGLRGEDSETTRGADASTDTAPTEDERNKLASAFSRGFTTAYLEGKRGNEIMSYQRPNNRGQFIGRVKWVRNGKAGVNCEQQLVPGDVVEFWTKRGRSAVTITESANCSASFAEIPLDDKARVYESDRVFRVRSAEAAFKDDEHEPRVSIVGDVRLVIGEPLEASFRLAKPDEIDDNVPDAPYAAYIAQRLWRALDDEAAIPGTAQGAEVEPARSKAVTVEDVEAHIDRLGSTPFRLERLSIALDEGVGIGFSQLHHIRADALENLQENLLAQYRLREPYKITFASEPKRSNKRADAVDPTDVGVVALVTNADCAHAAKRAGALQIYVPALNYRRGMAEVAGCATYDAGQASYPKHCTLVMPVVSHGAQGQSREAKLSIDAWENVTAENNLLVQGLGDVQRADQLGASFEVSAHLPVVNQSALETITAFGAQCVWLSPELNLAQIADLAAQRHIPLGLKIFGAQELMTTEHCLLMSQGACDEQCDSCKRRTKPHVLKDRKGYEFPVMSDAVGRGHIYNSVKLDLTPELTQLIDAGVTYFMVDATLMNTEQTAQAVGHCVRALHDALSDSPDIQAQKRMSNSTSGHLHRGVL